MNEQRVTRTAALGGAGKNIVVAYLLWWFLGPLGIHRFYLDRTKSGLAQLLLLIFGWIPFFVGWIALGIWWLLDAYFVQEYVRQYNEANEGQPVAVSLVTTSKQEELATSALLISGFGDDGHLVKMTIDPVRAPSGQGYMIGRAAYCDMVIDAPTVSREHALILHENGIYNLRDLGSSNGTFLNERRLANGLSSVIRPGDNLRIGKVRLSVSPIQTF